MNKLNVILSLTRIVMSASIVIIPGAIHARHLTPEESLLRAESKIVINNIQRNSRSEKSNEYNLIYTDFTLSGEESFYIFNSVDDGYVILGADDRIPAILAMADSGHFNKDNIPSNLKWWLNEYSRQIQWIYEHESNYTVSEDFAPQDENITPLISTKWGQGAPFYNMCPIFNNRHCLTGCVATAMAQIMNYHKWPKQGKGENSYFCSYINQEIYACFGDTYYDWDNMISKYDSHTESQANAVATLLFQCGVATNMSYSLSNSGASDWDAEKAFRTYFSYDSTTIMIKNVTDYSQEEIITMFLNELNENRPIYFSGNSFYDGHSFIIDGYKNNGLFHINWGWSGSYDGYFRLSALDPYGNNSGFNFFQTFIIGIQPPGGSAAVRYPDFWGEGNFTFRSIDDKIMFVCDEGGFFNRSNNPINLYFTLKLINVDSEEIEYPTPSINDMPLVNYGLYELPCPDLSGVPNGIYKVYPVYKISESDSWHLVRMVPYETSRQYIYVTMYNGKATFFNDMPSSIEGVEGDNVKITVDGNSIHVSGVNNGLISVYSIDGRNVSSSFSENGNLIFDGLAPGLYIVRAGNSSAKVFIR